MGTCHLALVLQLIVDCLVGSVMQAGVPALQEELFWILELQPWVLSAWRAAVSDFLTPLKVCLLFEALR